MGAKIRINFRSYDRPAAIGQTFYLERTSPVAIDKILFALPESFPTLNT